MNADSESLQNEQEGNRMEEEKKVEKSKGRRIFDEIMSWVKPMVLAMAAALLLNRFVIVNATVPTGSMENTIQPGDRLMGNRLAYLKGEPERGDIVIFKYPVNEEENYIKRVIGLSGEKVAIQDGEIYIDDSQEPLEEPYLKDEWIVKNDNMVFEVPEGCYLVLGDNRNSSLDSRYWAEEAIYEGIVSDIEDASNYSFVSKEKILGKAMFTYWPEFSKLTQ